MLDPIIILTEKQIERAKHFASLWTSVDKVNYKVGPATNYDTSLRGVGAQIAAATFFEVPDNLELREPWDLNVNGQLVNVKWISITGGKLLVKPLDFGLNENAKQNALPAKWFLLVEGILPKYDIKGFVLSPLAALKKFLWDPAHGVCYAIPQDNPVFWTDFRLFYSQNIDQEIEQRLSELTFDLNFAE